MFAEVTSECPLEGFGFVMAVVFDERQDPLTKLRLTREAAMLDKTPDEDREPDLDLVEPGRVFGGVYKLEAAAMTFVEKGPAVVASVVVNIEVIPDNDDLADGKALGYLLHEVHKLGGSPLVANLAKDLARAHVHCGN